MHKTGICVDPSPLSRKNTGEAVTYFGVNSQRLSDHHWMQIMMSYSINSKGKKKMEINDRSTSSISAAFIFLAAPNHPTTSIKQSKVCYPSPVCPFPLCILTTSIVGLKHGKIHWPQPHLIHVPQLLYG